MLVIDEIHSLLAGTFREQRIILNAIRFLANDLRIPLVCLGTDEANQALMTDPQLADRFAAAELPAWEDDAAFEQLLLSFESILPLRQPSEFRDPKVHQRILSLTRGCAGPYLPADGNRSHRSDSFRRRAHRPFPVEGRPGDRVTGVDRGQAYPAVFGMISAAIAPARLPFAPRPISTELLSSWLLRVAAANCVELSELLQGLEYRYGRVLTNLPIDYSLPDAAVRALSQFCRVAPEKIRVLDLRQRAPHLNPALLLRVQNPLAVLMCARSNLSRVRYAFCPLCIASQRVIHVHWEWSSSMSHSLRGSSNTSAGRLPGLR